MTYPIEYQADHTLLLALPAFAPAVVVVGVVVYVAMRDRRRGEDGDPSQDDDVHSSGEDGSP
ncbi:hypothetical protein [Mycolicibacterium houstonense]|uniref:hypothetical protein n=1 Tax=Mycolicibacterium houstonense TaxID=146021 RepID=UPI00082B11B1|nr:hypothetical protein [Mycolicibacterium houstonense]MCV7067693.1 hypothetical protein [Mycolicibacterium farcinogenes]